MMANRLLRRSGVAVALIAELLEWKPSVIFQVGVGTHHKETEVFQEVWPDAELIGWEPHPEIFKRIKDPLCIDVDDFPGELHQCALGKYTGRRDFYYDAAHVEGASFFGGEKFQSISVKVRSMDDCYPPPENAETLFWLDCEGAELEVLEGAVEFIKGVDVINIELTGVPPRVGWPSPVEVNRWLLDHGFFSQYIHTHRCTSGQNDMVYVKPELFRPEYCSCPLQVEDFWRKQGNC